MQVLHMNKGNGDTSYAKNSTVQRTIIYAGKGIMQEAMLEMLYSNVMELESMGIADLGCSSGPNTLSVISEIMETVEAVNCHLGRRLVSEFRVFLNDLYSNDFNNVFMSLPAFYKRLKEEKGLGFGSCFVSGVPGSFYGRLFPTNSLHFVHSSSSLHWLSQVPVGLQSNALKCVNKGKLYISKSSPQSVMDAYSLQFRNDFSIFLKSRSQELVPSGRMVLSFLGRKSADPTTEDSCYHWELLAQAIMSLAREGRIEEDKVDSFNAPYYAPCTEEIKEEIQKEGSFTIDLLEGFEIDWDGGVVTDIHTPQGKLLVGQRVANTIRAVVESMLVSHFGIEADVMDDLFIRFADMVGTHLSKSRTKYINLAMVLIKKG
ncbi:jasmonic acid carboxyl methyltransferase [Hibiscus trionum]|uniref:Jasmonic acid carboxyl methyltransferase n=1 Tax=Hibiscus trionum TaxID=183268 RepID=A0A9W7IIN3_HIBTR|nr:jasmonic acid carboxyl methyltransferase [Hibiscus trionum]